MPESNTPPEPNPQEDRLTGIESTLNSITEWINGERDRRRQTDEPDEELRGLTDMLSGLGSKLDAILGHVTPKETKVGDPPAAANTPPSPTTKPPRRPGLFW